MTRLMHKDRRARARTRTSVEVPFEFIAPSPENYWTQNSARGVDVPLGRAGATKLQNVQARARGTSQHVLDRRQDRVGQVDVAPRPHH